MSSPFRESLLSRRLRLAAGCLALGALGLAVVGLATGMHAFALVSFLASCVVPYGVMVGHLSVTQALTHEEKTLWRRELWSSPRSVIAVWAYLFASDLGERARGFPLYRRGQGTR